MDRGACRLQSIGSQRVGPNEWLSLTNIKKLKDTFKMMMVVILLCLSLQTSPRLHQLIARVFEVAITISYGTLGFTVFFWVMKRLWASLCSLVKVWPQAPCILAGSSPGIWGSPSFFIFLRLQCMLVHSEVSCLRHGVYVPEYLEGKTTRNSGFVPANNTNGCNESKLLRN